MTENEMTSCINDILCQLFTDTNASSYSNLLAASYNLWAFLYYDANCEYPKCKPIKEGYFEF